MPTYIPPQVVADNAKLALEVRQEKPSSEKGMTAVGIARAVQLSNKRPVSIEVIYRMNSYFERHEVDKQGSTWKEQGKGWQAWYGWGGDEGWQWAKRIIKEYEAMETKISKRHSEADMKLIRTARKQLEEVKATLIELGDDGVEELMKEVATEEIKADLELFSDKQVLLAETLTSFVADNGLFSKDMLANGSHYMEDNPFNEQGINCMNCIFYNNNQCGIVEGEIADTAICKFWIVPDSVIENSMVLSEQEQEQELEVELEVEASSAELKVADVRFGLRK